MNDGTFIAEYLGLGDLRIAAWMHRVFQLLPNKESAVYKLISRQHRPLEEFIAFDLNTKGGLHGHI